MSMVILVSSHKCYSELISKAFDCIYGYMTEALSSAAVTSKFLNTVYAKANVVFNFLLDQGFTLFDLY